MTKWIQSIEQVPSTSAEEGLTFRNRLADNMIQVGIKSDLKMDPVRDYQRPEFNREAIKIGYSEIEPNADYIFTEQQRNLLSFTLVNLTKATFRGQEMYRQPSTITSN